jgi:lysophospholipase L1-like esterase
MIVIKKAAFAVLMCMITLISAAEAQEKSAFWSTIMNYKVHDSETPIPDNTILFLGSSTFTRWDNMQEMLPDYPLVNRGFGGSTLPDIIVYLQQVGLPKHVKQVVLYCGDNDIANGANAQTVLTRLMQVMRLIRVAQPDVPVAYLSIKKSLGRLKFVPVVEQANKLVRNYISKQENMVYVDVCNAAVTADGQPMADIFVEDGIHMNQKGYDIWARVLKPYLLH